MAYSRNPITFWQVQNTLSNINLAKIIVVETYTENKNKETQ